MLHNDKKMISEMPLDPPKVPTRQFQLKRTFSSNRHNVTTSSIYQHPIEPAYVVESRVSFGQAAKENT